MATPQDYWNTPDPALMSWPQAPGWWNVHDASRNPISLMVPGGQPTIDAMMTRDQADLGKSPFQVDAEQLTGSFYNAPKLVLGPLVDYFTGSVQNKPSQQPPPADTPIAGMPAIPGLPSGEAVGQTSPQQAMLLALGGGETSPMQLPEVPRPAGPNVGGFLSALRGLGPTHAPQLEETFERPAPIAPDLGPAQEFVASMQAPTAPDEGVRKTRKLMGIMSAIADGANRSAERGGGLWAQLANAGGEVGRAMSAEFDKVAQEDQTYQAAVRQYQVAKFQAEQSIRDSQQRYAQAVQDTTSANEIDKVGARNRLASAQADFAERQRQYQITVAEAGFRAQQAAAEAQNRYLDRVMEQNIAQLKINAEFKKPLVIGDQVYIRDATGQLKPFTGAAAGGGGLKALMALGNNDGLLPEVQRHMQGWASMQLGIQQGNPQIAQMAVVDSLVPQAQTLLPDFDSVVKKINEKGMLTGVLPGTTAYPKFYEEELKREILVRLNENGGEGFRDIATQLRNPLAAAYVQVFQ